MYEAAAVEPPQLDPTAAAEQEEQDLAAAEQLAMQFLAQQPDLIYEEVIDPPYQEPQSLRRSARISIRGFTKNYSPKKSRKKKKTAANPAFSEADLLMALQTENLEAVPLDQGMEEDIDRYCGLADIGAYLPHGEGPSNTRQEELEGNKEDYGESIIGDLEFNSEDDRFTDEEEASADEDH